MLFSLSRFLTDPKLLGNDFAGETWANWRTVLKAALAEPMTKAETEQFRTIAGRQPPEKRVSELWLAIGRRAGKDSVASAIAAYVAANGDFQRHLRRGEKATILCLATNKDQAGIVFGYIRAFFEEVPLLKSLFVSAKDGVITLNNSVEIVTAAVSFRSLRGKTLACVICDEIAFWRDENFANPDKEIFNAVTPAMISLRSAGALLIAISTTYRKAGLLYERVSELNGVNDPDALAILAPSVTFNPLLAEPQAAAEIERQLQRDPEAARAEWLSEWRSDLTDMFDRQLVERAVDKDVTIREFNPRHSYTMCVDASGGRSDSFCAAVGHRENDDVVVDAIYEKRAPFDPDDAIDEVADLASAYHVYSVHGDDYGSELIAGRFRAKGLFYRPITITVNGAVEKLNRSTTYLNSLSVFTAGRVRLLDSERLINQLVSLERRAGRSGHATVDHPRGQHDDIANAVCGVVVMLGVRNAADWMRNAGAAAQHARLGPAALVVSMAANANPADPDRPQTRGDRYRALSNKIRSSSGAGYGPVDWSLNQFKRRG